MTFIRLIKERVQKSQKKILQDENQKKLIDQFVSKYGSGDTKSWFMNGKKKQLEITEAMSKGGIEEDKNIDFASEEELAIYSDAEWEELDKSKVAKSDRIDILDFLFKYPQLECDQRDIFGRSPLHYAARSGSFTCTTRLLERGPDLNAVDKDMVCCILHAATDMPVIILITVFLKELSGQSLNDL
jgi:Ankyrin repeats (many copies)